MKEKLNINTIRHLEDLDNFSSGKRDGNIIEGQEELVRKYSERFDMRPIKETPSNSVFKL